MSLSFTFGKWMSAKLQWPVFRSMMPMRSVFFCVELNTTDPFVMTRLRIDPLRVYSPSVTLHLRVAALKATTMNEPSLSRSTV